MQQSADVVPANTTDDSSTASTDDAPAEKEIPKTPGNAPTNVDDVDSKGVSFWCNPTLPGAQCGGLSWGRYITPMQGFQIYYAIAVWQVVATTAIY